MADADIVVSDHRLNGRLLNRSCVSSGVTGAFCEHVQTLNGGESMLGCEVRVAYGHSDDFVTQKLLNRPKVNSSHYKTAGEGVPQAVPAKICKDWPV